MNLIAIVLALLLEGLLSHSAAWRTHDLTGRWMQWLDGLLGVRSWSLALYLLLPVGAVAALDYWLGEQVGGALLQLPLSLLVLVSCIGPRDLREQIQAWREFKLRGAEAEAEARLASLLQGPRRQRGEGRGAGGRSPVAACFVQGHERWAAILFWFFWLGPAGAVAYRVTGSVALHLRDKGYAEDSLRLADWLHGALAWPSARLSALCFALAGSADEAFAHWRGWRSVQKGGWTRDSWPLLAEIGLVAMRQDPEETRSEAECLDAALRLLQRSLMLLLAFLALLTIGGWMS